MNLKVCQSVPNILSKYASGTLFITVCPSSKSAGQRPEILNICRLKGRSTEKFLMFVYFPLIPKDNLEIALCTAYLIADNSLQLEMALSVCKAYNFGMTFLHKELLWMSFVHI